MTHDELFNFLEYKYNQYNTLEFIESDPVQIPHHFTKKEDIEIAGFLAATIAWGNRKMIIKSANYLMQLMDFAPHDFIINHQAKDLSKLNTFVYRTFQNIDLQYFIISLQNIYLNHGGLEEIFNKYQTSQSLQPAIHEFKKVFFNLPHPQRTEKHIADPLEGSSAKRINLFLRWMIRNDKVGVDFGIWKKISPAILSCPLDVHSGNVARKLGLLSRIQNDAKAVLELDNNLRNFDPSDPVKYDFALFGLGVFERF